MTLDYTKLIDKMTIAFQEATFKTMTYVDAKRGVDAAFKALQDYIPICHPLGGTDCIDADTLHEIKTIGRE